MSGPGAAATWRPASCPRRRSRAGAVLVDFDVLARDLPVGRVAVAGGDHPAIDRVQVGPDPFDAVARDVVVALVDEDGAVVQVAALALQIHFQVGAREPVGADGDQVVLAVVLLVDLAVPRDVEAEVADMDDVFLYSVDDLGQVVREGMDNRVAQVAQAEAIIETKSHAILDFIKSQRGTVKVVFEEGTQAAWLYDLIDPHVAQVVVCDPRKIAREGLKADRPDARRLAELLRTNSLSPVYHGERSTRALKEFARGYMWLVRDSTRVKNRLKALFRARGIDCDGSDIYDADQRSQWLGKLDSPAICMCAGGSRAKRSERSSSSILWIAVPILSSSARVLAR